MRYHRLYIHTDGTIETYNKISSLLEIKPTEFENDKNLVEERYGTWTYSVDVAEEEPYFDFINGFLDLLEPKFIELEKLGITKDKIIFWLIYEYDEQCAMGYNPQEMKRLGDNGIALNIDCHFVQTKL